MGWAEGTARLPYMRVRVSCGPVEALCPFPLVSLHHRYSLGPLCASFLKLKSAYRGSSHLRNPQFLKGKGSDLPLVSYFKETRKVARLWLPLFRWRVSYFKETGKVAQAPTFLIF